MISDLLERKGLNVRRKTATEACSPCPFCGGEDRFCIWPEKNRAHCIRGCGWNGDEIQLLRDLDGMTFREAAEAVGRGDSGRGPMEKPIMKTKWNEGKFVARWDYHDESGKPLYRVERYDFPDGDKEYPTFPYNGNGELVKGKEVMKGIRRVLYRLPEMLKYGTSPVWIAEGEKCCDLLYSLEFRPATCNPGGAGKWPKLDKEHRIGEPLKGRIVYILPDNDEPGRKHAQEVAQALYGRAKEVKILELPGLPEKGDVFDFHKAHGPDETLKTLMQLADTNRPWKPTERLEINRPSGREIASSRLDFPSQVIGGAAGHFSDVYASCLESPRHFFFMSFLTCLGSLLAERLTLASEIRPQPRLYTILLGESADDRKSTAISKTIEFFRETVEGFKVCWGVGSAEGLQKQLERSPSLLLCFDELKQFVGKAQIETSILLPCVNTLFESNRYESQTKKTGINLENALLSLLAASTVETFERMWDRSFTDIGFPNRLFLVPGHGEKRFAIPPKVADSARWNLKQELGGVLRHVGDRLELDFTPSARDLFQNWYMGMENSIHNRRLEVYALRLMCLLAVNEMESEVSESIVKNAIALCDWQLEVRKQHDPIDADNEVARMEEAIRRHLRQGPQTERDLKRRTHTERVGLRIFEWARNNLVRAKETKWDKGLKRWRLCE